MEPLIHAHAILHTLRVYGHEADRIRSIVDGFNHRPHTCNRSRRPMQKEDERARIGGYRTLSRGIDHDGAVWSPTHVDQVSGAKRGTSERERLVCASSKWQQCRR